MSPPWMPFYVADYLADTGHLGTLEHGAYMLLIMHYWQKGGLPNDDKQLARITRMTDEQFSNARILLAEFFSNDWQHERIDAELSKAESKTGLRKAAGRRGGDAKASNARILLEQNGSNALASSSQPQPDIERSMSTASPIDLALVQKKREAKAAEESLLQDLGDGWNELARSCGLAEIKTIKDGREAALRARLREAGEYGFDDPRSCFSVIFARVRGSPLLSGQATNWKADFDFILTPKGFRKILEGAYEVQSKSRVYA